MQKVRANKPKVKKETPKEEWKLNIFSAFFNWDSFHARSNNHYKAWCYKKKKNKKIKAYRKPV